MADKPKQDPVKCPECGVGLVNIATGAVCPNGHAGLHPTLTPEQSRSHAREARVRTLPEAYLVEAIVAARKGKFADKCIYRVKDETGIPMSGYYRRIIRASSSLDKHDDKTVLANLRGRAVELVTWEGVGSS